MSEPTFYDRLCTAQLAMQAPIKDAENPHFRSSYATLESVRKVCVPLLNGVGIYYYCVVVDGCAKSIFTDGEASISVEVPIIAAKQDAQGYGSALTYARRYGLLMLAGLAPADDDDGNAAVKSIEEAPEPTHQEHATAIMAKFKGIEDRAALDKAKAYLKSDKCNSIPDEMMKALWLGLLEVEEALGNGE